MSICLPGMRMKTRKRKMKKDKTLTELIVGIIFLGAVAQIIILIAFQNDLYNAAGLWSGIVIGIGMAVHMKHSIEDALDLGEEGAPKHIRKTYAFRMTVVIIAMGCVLYFDFGNPLTLLVGLIALKISAYLQPYMHKLFLKLKKSK